MRTSCTFVASMIIFSYAASFCDEPYYRDLFSDTWVATDALGRTMPDAAEAGPVKEGQRRVVGIFYITWHADSLYGMKSPFSADVSKILAQDPNARLDGAHPRALVHHQKMVVIDDALAVCGGIDMTADRRDTRDRLVGDDRLFRVGASNPNNRSMGGDAEGKLSIKAGPGNAALSDRIVTLRDDPSGGLAIPRATFWRPREG